MLVSVITPTYNRWKWIPSVVQSFLSQTCRDSELLIVDDGDQGPIEASILSSPRVRYIRLDGERRTVGEKRNICCVEAQGEFICHFDNDDWAGPDRIEDQVSTLQSTGMQVMGYHGVLIWDEVYQRAHRYNQENGYPRWAFAHGATFCYKRAWWKQFPFEERTGKEDSFFAKTADKRGQFTSKAAEQNIVLRAHVGNTYKPPLDRITVAGGSEQVPAEFFRMAA